MGQQEGPHRCSHHGRVCLQLGEDAGEVSEDAAGEHAEDDREGKPSDDAACDPRDPQEQDQDPGHEVGPDDLAEVIVRPDRGQEDPARDGHGYRERLTVYQAEGDAAHRSRGAGDEQPAGGDRRRQVQRRSRAQKYRQPAEDVEKSARDAG
jgi:hypothetical protein